MMGLSCPRTRHTRATGAGPQRATADSQSHPSSARKPRSPRLIHICKAGGQPALHGDALAGQISGMARSATPRRLPHADPRAELHEPGCRLRRELPPRRLHRPRSTRALPPPARARPARPARWPAHTDQSLPSISRRLADPWPQCSLSGSRHTWRTSPVSASTTVSSYRSRS